MLPSDWPRRRLELSCRGAHWRDDQINPGPWCRPDRPLSYLPSWGIVLVRDSAVKPAPAAFSRHGPRPGDLVFSVRAGEQRHAGQFERGIAAMKKFGARGEEEIAVTKEKDLGIRRNKI